MQYKDSPVQKEEKLYNSYLTDAMKDGSLMYVGELLARAARMKPDTIALIYQDTSVTYYELYRRVCLFAAYLKQRGLKPRDRALLFFENSIEFYVGYYAILHTGAIVVPLNIFLSEREFSHILADAKPTLIVASKELLSKVVTVDSLEIPVIHEDMMHIPDERQQLDETIIACKPDEMAALLYTSGTTGLPKGVMLSSSNMIINILQGLVRYDSGKPERVFAVLPLFHSFAQNTCVWASFYRMYTVIVVPRIDRRAILAGLKHKPTIFLGVPALYGLLCLLKTAPLDSVRLFVSGGDAISDKIRSAFALLYRRKICSGYGLTETSPLVSVSFDDETTSTNTVGRPCMGVQCSIRDEEGKEVSRGSIGELWVSGPNVMLGYYNAPEMTAQVMHDKWFKTGDLAYFDTKGRIVISGRIKDLIIHKGFNIYPQEIENVILAYGNAIRAAVIGISDAETGEVPVAYVQLRETDDKAEGAIKTLCKQNLAAYKVPRTIICVIKDLPLTATGKVNKKKLQEIHKDTTQSHEE